MPLSLSKLKEMANNLPKNHSAQPQWQCCTPRQQQASDITNAVGHLISRHLRKMAPLLQSPSPMHRSTSSVQLKTLDITVNMKRTAKGEKNWDMHHLIPSRNILISHQHRRGTTDCSNSIKVHQQAQPSTPISIVYKPWEILPLIVCRCDRQLSTSSEPFTRACWHWIQRFCWCSCTKTQQSTHYRGKPRGEEEK